MAAGPLIAKPSGCGRRVKTTMHVQDTTLDQVVRELSAQDDQARAPIPRDRVLKWMKESDIEVLGATYTLILDERHNRRIEPPLAFDDYHAFVMRYYEGCLLENPDGTW